MATTKWDFFADEGITLAVPATRVATGKLQKQIVFTAIIVLKHSGYPGCWYNVLAGFLKANNIVRPDQIAHYLQSIDI